MSYFEFLETKERIYFNVHSAEVIVGFESAGKKKKCGKLEVDAHLQSYIKDLDDYVLLKLQIVSASMKDFAIRRCLGKEVLYICIYADLDCKEQSIKTDVICGVTVLFDTETQYDKKYWPRIITTIHLAIFDPVFVDVNKELIVKHQSKSDDVLTCLIDKIEF